MPSYGVPYVFPINLFDTAIPGEFLANPPIETGDFRIVLGDTNAEVNLTNLPIIHPGSPVTVLVTLTAAEMSPPTAEPRVLVLWKDLDAIPLWGAGSEFFTLVPFAPIPSSTNWLDQIQSYDVEVRAKENALPFLDFGTQHFRRVSARGSMVSLLQQIQSLLET